MYAKALAQRARMTNLAADMVAAMAHFCAASPYARRISEISVNPLALDAILYKNTVCLYSIHKCYPCLSSPHGKNRSLT